jgi:hypothetical protein
MIKNTLYVYIVKPFENVLNLKQLGRRNIIRSNRMREMLATVQ